MNLKNVYTHVTSTPSLDIEHLYHPRKFSQAPSSQSLYPQAIIVLIPITIDSSDHVFEFYISGIITYVFFYVSLLSKMG